MRRPLLMNKQHEVCAFCMCIYASIFAKKALKSANESAKSAIFEGICIPYNALKYAQLYDKIFNKV